MPRDAQVHRKLCCLFTDMKMLMDGDWEPDTDSVKASIDNLNDIQQLLNLPELEDTREEDAETDVE